MRASQYIKELQHLIDIHGDLEVEKWMPATGRVLAKPPTLAYRMKAQDGPRGGTTSTRDGVQSFWNPADHARLKGDEVIRV